MIRLTKLSIIIFISFVTSCNEIENRKKIVIIETGVRETQKLKPFLCKDGHQSFLTNSPWNQDREGHGSKMANVIAERINPEKSCILVYKTADKGLESDKRAEAYAKALIHLTRIKPNNTKVILIALEDVSYFYKEVGWFNSILSDTELKIAVSAGNSGVQLRENNECSVYPACLKRKLLTKEIQSRFVIVGSTDGKFNDGSMIDVKRKSGGLGTSISAARFASEMME